MDLNQIESWITFVYWYCNYPSLPICISCESIDKFLKSDWISKATQFAAFRNKKAAFRNKKEAKKNDHK